jgi:phosphatidylglycerol---prolipoprotein diacylglyceryl transferase
MDIFASITWDVSPEIFSLGFIKIRWYGLLFALAFVTCYYIMYWIFKKENKSQKQLESLTIYLVLATVIGARLGHCLFYDPVHYLSNPFEMIKVWEGGLASHGAGFGILIALWLYVRKYKDIKYMWILDRVAVVIPMAAIFVRLGNFFNSEIVGIPSDLPWAVLFVNDKSHIPLVARHPSQLYEALAYLITFIVVFFTYKKYKEATPNGRIMGLMLVLLFTARFLIEFLKENQSSFEHGMALDMGQFLSIPFVLVGLYFFIKSFKENKS